MASKKLLLGAPHTYHAYRSGGLHSTPEQLGKSLRELGVKEVEELLEHDIAVKVAGVDVDGMLRGKIMTKDKFFSAIRPGGGEESGEESKEEGEGSNGGGGSGSGFGFCSVVFGWDMHDTTYAQELKVSNRENGYRDLTAVVDLSSYRRIPWEDGMPFFFVRFLDPVTGKPVSADPRGLVREMTRRVEEKGYKAMAGAEYEFYQFKIPETSTSVASFLRENAVEKLPSLTEGMFGYSLTRPAQNKEYFYGILDACEKFRCPIEGWHTESGPGVFEAALQFNEAREMADRAALFKLTVKSLGASFNITPSFMAKPRQGLPGNSGHMHISLVDASTGKNIFARETPDDNAPYPDVKYVSDKGRHFLAGVLAGLADVMPILAPTVNSYKRLVENFWAPVTVSWGLEHRAASVRIIAPPSASAKATRFEIRTPGADTNAHLVLATILALGWRGIEKRLEIPIPPLGKGEDVGGKADKGERLARNLREATEKFVARGSVAREVFGDEFVEHFAGTREHEVRLWEEAVTDWEVRRYIETV